MARAKLMDEWDRAAWLCLHMPRFSKKRYSLSDFQPFRRAEKKTSMKKLDKIVASGLLPDKLSNEEAEKVLEKYMKKENDGGRD